MHIKLIKCINESNRKILAQYICNKAYKASNDFIATPYLFIKGRKSEIRHALILVAGARIHGVHWQVVGGCDDDDKHYMHCNGGKISAAATLAMMSLLKLHGSAPKMINAQLLKLSQSDQQLRSSACISTGITC